MPSNINILLVEDNPMVLGMLRQALAPMAKLSTASDGADALLQALDAPPDLIISDFNMSGMDGKQLLTKLRGRPQTARVSFILMASKTDIGEKLRVLQDQVEDLIEKPFFLKDAVARIKRVIDKIALEKVDIESDADLLRRFRYDIPVIYVDGAEAFRHRVDPAAFAAYVRGEHPKSLVIEKCELCHGGVPPVKGDDAVYKVMSWTGGNFTIDFTGKSGDQTVTRSTQGLLMEGMRLLDEQNRDHEENVLEA